jgi:putative restriction endonuclease
MLVASARFAMKGYVANTDADWYAFLRDLGPLDEVNFWQPSGGRAFHAIAPGEPIFFRLKRPLDRIAGFGLLARHERMPVRLAWDCFGHGNGARSFAEMLDRVRRYVRRAGEPPAGPMHEIGCLMISSPVFFEVDHAVAEPEGWAKNIVSGKTYSLEHGEGRRIWQECVERVRPLPAAAEDAPRYGEGYVVRPRLGQGTFRAAVTMAYGRACAVTGEHSLPVVEAAHIKPYAEGGEHSVGNGLALRSDIHRLFDTGYVTVTPDHRFLVSKRLREDFDNGHTYYPHHGKPIVLPRAVEDRPRAEALSWHNESRFNG